MEFNSWPSCGVGVAVFGVGVFVASVVWVAVGSGECADDGVGVAVGVDDELVEGFEVGVGEAAAVGVGVAIEVGA